MSKFDSARIPTFSPGAEWYANQVLSGVPFSFVRYGEGDLRAMCPYLPVKRAIWTAYPHAREEFISTVVDMPRHPRYWPAIWHQGNLIKRKSMTTFKRWLVEVGLDNVGWHHGRVWRWMVDSDQTHLLVRAIRSQPLPVVVVGPERIAPAVEKLSATHIVTPFSGPLSPGVLGQSLPGILLEAIYLAMPRLREEMLVNSPALYTISASAVGKMLIAQLFPVIGEESFMIDVGAMWDGLSSCPSRPHQRKFTPEKIELNWEGP